jgi:molybdopterin molybdotransferase
MVSVSEASSIIQNNLWQPITEEVQLLNSMHRVLAENIFADRNFPPFDRVTMDGIAISYETLQSGQRIFPVAGIQAAGMPINKLPSPDVCMEVMTGAMLPIGADAVVKYEDLKIMDGKAEIISHAIVKNENIHRSGNDAKQGSLLISQGTLISSAEIPLMASVGKSSVIVYALPRTAIISTGDELVELDSTPQPHQIRKSNVYALAAGLSRFGVEAEHHHLADNEEDIKQRLDKILEDNDLIILSGGVSKGKFDLIPKMLESFGIKKHFHQVSQRPGKPIWFGTGQNKIVFALPGNPVSTFMCFYKYIEPWLIKSLGSIPIHVQAILAQDFVFNAPLTYFLQVKIINEQGRILAMPVPGGGSGDFVNLKDVDGFLELPQGVVNFKKGEAYDFISFRK